MTYADFKLSPWGKSHTAYRTSPLGMNPAPEYASSEVLIAGLYRTIGLPGVSEGSVPGKGKELDRTIAQARDKNERPEGAALVADDVHALLKIVLESPKLPNQSSKRFIQVLPLVGETATFSGSARLAGNPWPAGQLVRRMMWMGASTNEQAVRDWNGLFNALAVEEREDIFARFVKDELSAWTTNSFGELVPGGEASDCLPENELEGLACPARQFVRDLGAVIEAKPVMTRRQWISLLDALVRVASVAHVAWLCEVQSRIWDCLQAVLNGRDAEGEEQVRERIFPRQFSYLRFGTGAVSELKDRTSRYLRARLGVNAVLWALDDEGCKVSSLGSAADLAKLCSAVVANRGELSGLQRDVQDLVEKENRTLRCSKGIGSNLMEFATHVLRQRPTADERLRGYDQGYVLRKRGPAKSSPLICSPGPVSLLAIVHCSLAGLAGPRSVQRLAQHLGAYGIALDHADIAQTELGQQLRMLGLVLDSPDAESGMLLVPPFAQAAAN